MLYILFQQNLFLYKYTMQYKCADYTPNEVPFYELEVKYFTAFLHKVGVHKVQALSNGFEEAIFLARIH